MFDDFAASAFLRTIRGGTNGVRLRGYFEKKDPRKAGDKGRKAPWNLQTISEWIAEGRGIYVVIGAGGDKDAEITHCPALFAEWDDRPREWQLDAWQELGLPKPSLQVDTGGKSIHNYWVFEQPIEPDRFRDLQTRLAAVCGSDTTLKNPARVMRLPGCPRGGEGPPDQRPMVQLLEGPACRYPVNALEAVLPAPRAPVLLPVSYAAGPDARTIDDIREALGHVPRRVADGGTYQEYRNLLWGLGHALADIGRDPREAITLMEHHSPSKECGWDIEQVFNSGGSGVTTASFWGQCLKHGYQAAPINKSEVKPAPTTKKKHFQLLGYETPDYYWYLPQASGIAKRLAARAHTPTSLLTLAPIDWWAATYQTDKGGVDWQEATSAVFAAQHEVGIFEPDRLRGRGAWIDRGKVVLHMGNHLLIDGAKHDINNAPTTGYIYPRAAPLHGVTNVPGLTDEQGMQLLQIATMFRWERPVNGFLLCGWLALSAVCGVLSWRPHVWLTGSPSAGKSTLMEEFIRPLVGEFALTLVGAGATEAGLRQRLGATVSDARSVVVDEMDPYTQNDLARIESILGLARGSSSNNDAAIVKGTSGGSCVTYRIRSMFLFLSVSAPLKSAADRRRFALLQLINPSKWPEIEARDHWEHLSRELQSIESNTANKIFNRMSANLPVVRETVSIFRKAGRKYFSSQAEGDQLGTLMAGAWLLQSLQTPSQDQAIGFLANQDWEAQESAAGIPDERRCLDIILQQSIRVEGSLVARTALELIQCLVNSSLGPHQLQIGDAEDALGRVGLRVASEKQVLYVSNNSNSTHAALKATPWKDSWPDQLSRLDGAEKTIIRYKAIGTHRSVAVPLRLIE